MTWIIGTTSLSGHAILASDVCVTFKKPDGRRDYVDCLQKIYPLGRFVLGGFSGSVKIGFEMLGALSTRFDAIPQNHAMDIDAAAGAWLPGMAEQVFGLFGDKEKDDGCSIILGWVHPTRNRDALPWPWSYVYTFVSPEFSPLRDRPLEVLSIGSGAAVIHYMKIARNVCSSGAFMSTRGKMQAAILATTLAYELERKPVLGISKFFQIGLIARGTKGSIVHHDMGQIRFPAIARSYSEFEQMCWKRGYSAEAATAL
jgi:hypothetical protein